jgi:hypothetical protein
MGADPNWSPAGNSLLFGGRRDEAASADAVNPEIVDLRTHGVSVVRCSQKLWSPRWSRGGRRMLALSPDGDRLMLFDVQTQEWTELAKIDIGFPEWSRESDYIYSIGLPTGPPVGFTSP